ncbi:thermonuclease family protein [Humitalea rosea]|uniref:thermonuclease family protein n=1 Tax=Humitalea rosea TaxID=990373 RepID=UPI0011B39B53|nr:thermonuclease family protein [Humitalea rosea]
MTGLGLPSALMGSAPREQDWAAPGGEVRVVDGDTLRLRDRTVRLAGLLAPERGTRCTDAAGRGFDCGVAAAEMLSRLLRDRDVACRVRGRDRFGRGLGHCVAAETDLNLGLIGAGFALADTDAPVTLGTAEALARQRGQGLWAPGFTTPESWHRRP